MPVYQDANRIGCSSMEVLLIPNRFRASGTAHNHFCFQQIHMPLIPVKIKIAFVAAAPYRALPLKDDAAHVSIDTVIAQAESARQLFAAQQLAILHIGALQNIDPVTPAVGFNFFEFETCICFFPFLFNCFCFPFSSLIEENCNQCSNHP